MATAEPLARTAVQCIGPCKEVAAACGACALVELAAWVCWCVGRTDGRWLAARAVWPARHAGSGHVGAMCDTICLSWHVRLALRGWNRVGVWVTVAWLHISRCRRSLWLHVLWRILRRILPLAVGL